MAAQTRRPDPKPEPKRQPDFVIRAKNAQGYWNTIGAMWKADLKDKGEGWSIKISNMPVNWDGDCLAMVPLPKDE